MNNLSYKLFKEYLWLSKWRFLHKYSTVHIVVLEDDKFIEDFYTVS